MAFKLQIAIATLALFLSSPSITKAASIFFPTSNGQAIHKADLDGLNETELLGFPGQFASGIAFDTASGSVYFNQSSTNRVFRMDADGSNLQIFHQESADLAALDIDTSIDEIAWERHAGTNSNLFRRNVSGGGAVFLFSEASSGTSIHDIEIDTASGQIYWVQQENLSVPPIAKIRRANLDGSGVIVDVVTGLKRPAGLALGTVNGHLYWTDYTEDAVRRANLSGAGLVDVLVDTNLGELYDIDIDIAGGKLYFVEEQGTIHRMNLNGSGREALPITGRNFTALDLSPGSMVPIPPTVLLLGSCLIALNVTRIGRLRA